MIYILYGGGHMATKAHLAGNARYLEKLDDIKIRVPAGDRQKYRDFAESQGMSLNRLVVALLDGAMSGEISVSNLFKEEDFSK